LADYWYVKNNALIHFEWVKKENRQTIEANYN